MTDYNTDEIDITFDYYDDPSTESLTEVSEWKNKSKEAIEEIYTKWFGDVPSK